jgi:hypothetical protein
LAEIAGLDRESDFRHSDLQNLDFSNSDLRGYDFRGADLSGTVGIDVIWDDTTELSGATVNDSIFAARIRLGKFFEANERASQMLDAISRQDWAGQILWSGKNLLRSSRYHDIAMPVTEALFYRAKDDFLKAELLSYFAPRLESVDATKEVLLGMMSDSSTSGVVFKRCFRLIRKFKLSHDKVMRRSILSLLESNNEGVRMESFSFLVRTNIEVDELMALRWKAEMNGEIIGPIFVAEICKRLEVVYEFVTRDPITNSTFAIKTRVEPSVRDLIARKWARAERNLSTDLLNHSSAVRIHGGGIDEKEIEQKSREIGIMWKQLERYGIIIRVKLDKRGDPSACI